MLWRLGAERACDAGMGQVVGLVAVVVGGDNGDVERLAVWELSLRGRRDAGQRSSEAGAMRDGGIHPVVALHAQSTCSGCR